MMDQGGWRVREAQLGWPGLDGEQLVQYEVVDAQGHVLATIQDVGEEGRRIAHLMANAWRIDALEVAR